MKKNTLIRLIVSIILILSNFKGQTQTILGGKSEKGLKYYEPQMVDKAPQYGNGEDDFYRDIYNELKYPQDALSRRIEGDVVVAFTINWNGSINDLEVVKSVFPSLDKEAIRIISSLNGRWSNGIIQSRKKLNNDIPYSKSTSGTLLKQDTWYNVPVRITRIIKFTLPSAVEENNPQQTPIVKKESSFDMEAFEKAIGEYEKPAKTNKSINDGSAEKIIPDSNSSLAEFLDIDDSPQETIPDEYEYNLINETVLLSLGIVISLLIIIVAIALKRKKNQKLLIKREEEAKRRAEEEVRINAEKEAKRKADEEARIKAEKEEAKRKAEEEARINAEKEAKRKTEEEARIKAEMDAKRKAEEEARIKAEKEEAKRKAEEQARIELENNSYYYEIIENESVVIKGPFSLKQMEKLLQKNEISLLTKAKFGLNKKILKPLKEFKEFTTGLEDFL